MFLTYGCAAAESSGGARPESVPVPDRNTSASQVSAPAVDGTGVDSAPDLGKAPATFESSGASPAVPSDWSATGELLAHLRVEPERGPGYDRDDWPHWSDLDGDGCHTRCEVLAAERRPDGSWYSIFDGDVTNDPGRFDVDHLVPLAEAHESGGWRWDRQSRERFANDESYPHALIAVSASSNRSKGKKDPAEWLPPDAGSHCFYADAWVRVKFRWELSVDQAELSALSHILADCPAVAAEPVGRAPVAVVVAADSAPVPSPSPAVPATASVAHCDAGGELVRIEGPPGFDLSGWRISDEGARHSHVFVAGTVIPESATLLVASGPAEGDIKPWGARRVWNNDGDTATLVGPGGESSSIGCS